MSTDGTGPTSKMPFERRSRARQYRRGGADEVNSRAVFSAIDLGTNNCRLLIAKPTHGGFRVIDAFSRIVRLGEGVSGSGQMSEAAMNRAVDALAICAEKIKKRSVTCMRAVATEACRTAQNCDNFVARVREETGLNLDVISPDEEARLAVMGCQSLIAKEATGALVFDIGGGSTELIWVELDRRRQGRIMAWTSVPFGVVNLSECFMALDNACPAYQQMVAQVLPYIAAFEARSQLSQRIARGGMQLLGTSGTVTTLASLHLQLPRYDRRRVDGAWIGGDEVKDLARSVGSMSYSDRVAQSCIGEDRADLVVAGCAILDAILTSLPMARLRVADRGIREGLLRSMMHRGPRIDFAEHARQISITEPTDSQAVGARG